MDPLDWVSCVALDFETANESRASICSVGVCIIEDRGGGPDPNHPCDQVVPSLFSNGPDVRGFYSLVRPPELIFNHFNVMVHGITEDDVRDAPTFRGLWETVLRDLLENNLVLAHYAPFDMGALRAVLDYYELPYPRLDYLCTVSLARRVWPGWYSYSLPEVAYQLDLDFTHHHALEDAAAAGAIAITAAQDSEVESIAELAPKYHIHLGRLYPDGFDTCRGLGRSAKDFQLGSDDFDCEHPLFGRTVVFTGALDSMTRDDAMLLVVNRGGYVANGVSKKVDYLVLGQQDFWKLREGETRSTKLIKAGALIDKGHRLLLISEDDFLRMAY